MAAGLIMLKSLNNDKKVFRLAAKTAYLHAGLRKVLQEIILLLRLIRIGSMISFILMKAQ
jgi:glutamate-1-semialdehyde 2,1-aminomutase